ncbi:hypothetical protein GGR57DRAFT_447708 [Xylariaceae sp. FL1272]|nr:hypothetical protein GGR57DRAFT_447708 [Xylariaceae sp. FL1272]
MRSIVFRLVLVMHRSLAIMLHETWNTTEGYYRAQRTLHVGYLAHVHQMKRSSPRLIGEIASVSPSRLARYWLSRAGKTFD